MKYQANELNCTLHNRDYPVDLHFIKMSLQSMQIVRWHWHEEMELIVIINGRVWIKTEDNSMLLTQGQGLFLNQNLLHSIRSYEEEDCTLYSLRFHPCYLFESADTFLGQKYLKPVTESANLKHLILDPQNPLCREMLESVRAIIEVNLKKSFGFEITVKGLLCCLWQLILNYITIQGESQDTPYISGSDSRRIKSAIRYIEEHYTESLTLEEIADYIHISKSECCRCFKRTLGLTPFEYLMRYRIFEATRKIQQKEAVAETISNLSFSVGFNSPSYFNKIFKKYLHCTPLEYKHNITAGNEPVETNYLLLSSSIKSIPDKE